MGSFVELENRHRNFLRVLQLEYLTHKLRSMIYRDSEYARVSYEISEKKRKKISEIGLKFNLVTIFDDGNYFDDFLNMNFFQEFGMPNFQYKNEEQKKVQGNYDRWYMFYRGRVVLYHGRECKVLENNPSTQMLKILFKGNKVLVKYDEITIKNDFEWKK